MTALNAPRDLKECDSCSDSSFSHTLAPPVSDSQIDCTRGVRRRYGAIRLRAAMMSAGSTPENVNELLCERRSCEHVADARFARRVDHVSMHVGHETDG